MSYNTIIALFLTGILFLSLFLCIKKFLSVRAEKESQNTRELNSRIMKNWLEIHAYRNDDRSSVEQLSNAFDDMDKLHLELLNSTNQAASRISNKVFLRAVKLHSTDIREKV